jgi:hypothetical protein
MQKIAQTNSPPSELADLTTPARQVTTIDRIDDRGDLREHRTRDGHRTICGIEIGMRQPPCGNRPCKRCEKIAARCQKAPSAASGG